MSPAIVDDAAHLEAKPARIPSLDLGRGLIVAVMALDHVRMYFSNAQFDPLDLSKTTAAYYATRWVTHLCAPGFFFIAGLGIAIWEMRGAQKEQLSQFLLVRGLWLIAVEIVLMGPAWSFNVGWWWFGVLGCLGASFACLAGTVHLPRRIVQLLAVLVIAAGPLIVSLHFQPHTILAQIDTVLYRAGMVHIGPLGPKLVLFPLIPWFALMAAGYAFGPLLYKPDGARRTRLFALGALLIVAFAILRSTGAYGDAPAEHQAQPLGAILAFFNVDKYPPSLDFSLITIGILSIILAWLARFDARVQSVRWPSPLAAFGRAPFFFYVVHIWLIHLAALAAASILGWPSDFLFWRQPFPNDTPQGYGWGLVGVYATWAAVLTLMYPVCLFAIRQKSKHPTGLWRFL